MPRKQHANPRVQALIDSATEAGASDSIIDFLIPGWESTAPQTLEEKVRQEMDLAPPETKSEPTTPSLVEEQVRREMENPASTSEPLSPNPEMRERQVRQRMNLAPGDSEVNEE